METITGTVKNGQIQFDNIPAGYGIHIKNYDTDLSEDAFLTQEQQEEDQIFQDEDGWFYSYYFAELSDDPRYLQFEQDAAQQTLPIEGL